MLKVVSPFVEQEAISAETIAIETMRHSLVAFSDRPDFNALPLLRFLPLRGGGVEWRYAASSAEGNHLSESAPSWNSPTMDEIGQVREVLPPFRPVLPHGQFNRHYSLLHGRSWSEA